MQEQFEGGCHLALCCPILVRHMLDVVQTSKMLEVVRR
jgi:hypothetical protein